MERGAHPSAAAEHGTAFTAVVDDVNGVRASQRLREHRDTALRAAARAPRRLVVDPDPELSSHAALGLELG
jgi:hypothetical protein